MSMKELIRENNREHAAIHEASHVMIGFKQGHKHSCGAIQKCVTRGMWHGWARLWAHGPSEDERREFGVAGAIGEAILDGDESFRNREFWEGEIGENKISRSDWENIGIDPEEEWITDELMETVNAVGDYLKAHWSDVCKLARKMSRAATGTPRPKNYDHLPVRGTEWWRIELAKVPLSTDEVITDPDMIEETP